MPQQGIIQNALAGDSGGMGQANALTPQNVNGVGGSPFPLTMPGQPPRQQLPTQDYIDALNERGGDDAMEEIEHWVEMSGGALKAPWAREAPPHTGYSPGYQFPKPDANGNTTFNADNPDDAGALREYLKTLTPRR
tara:strand:+ start:867 stop:1274 length:408 start_codon:yes stop_codon:yes gene_type:complete